MPSSSTKMGRSFKLLSSIPVPEIQATYTELEHKKSKAKIIHIANQDPENVFCLFFKTHPKTSNGVAHILEHTVLCGSEKYPVKDPFFSMTRRSLSTFMNALTGSDFTCYPAASLNKKDFYNLLEVYLDAVFFPRLNYYSFLQEGHRLEFEKIDDPTQNLIFRGIVYNEMKGAMSSPESRLWQKIMQELFPTLTYGINSGGDPRQIPLLTYRQLVAFHKKYYHPSRCTFYFYGNFPLEEHLAFIDEKVLKKASCATPIPLLKKEKIFDAPRHCQQKYPTSADADSSTRQHMIALSWRLCSIKETLTILSLVVLEIVLMGNDAALLKKILLGSGLCQEVFSAIDEEMSEVPFILIAKGLEKSNIKKFEKLVFQTLQDIAKHKINFDLIEAAIHQIEFHRSEIKGSHYPYGLMLFMRSCLLQSHGADPLCGLKIHEVCSQLRTLFQKKDYACKLIEKFLLKSPNQVTIHFIPDTTLTSKELKEESNWLKKIKRGLSLKNQNNIIAESKKLIDFQKEQETQSIDVLPTIHLNDIAKKTSAISLAKVEKSITPTYHCNEHTNDIIYATFFFDLPYLHTHELFWLELFCLCATEMGYGNKNYASSLNEMQQYTGGISISYDFFSDIENVDLLRPALVLKGKALYKNTEHLFRIFDELISYIHFSDLDRLYELVVQLTSSIETNLNNQAMRYASIIAHSTLNLSSHLVYKMSGLHNLSTLKNILTHPKEELPKLAHILSNLHKRLLGHNHVEKVITCDRSFFNKIKKEPFFTNPSIQQGVFTPWKYTFKTHPLPFQCYLISAPVAFCSMATRTIGYTHPQSAHLAIASNLMDNLHLHHQIREIGGAYGGGSSFNSSQSYFSFYSYRDPQVASTIEAFYTSAHEISKGTFSSRELQEAKIGLIQKLDQPITPGAKGYIAYARKRSRKSDQLRQQYRTQLLRAEKKEITEAIQKYLIPHLEKASCVCFTCKELIEKENAILKKQKLKTFQLKMIH